MKTRSIGAAKEPLNGGSVRRLVRGVARPTDDHFRGVTKMVPRIPDSMCLLSCKCGHEADFEEFQRTEITGDLRAGTFQCPKCRHAWRMEAIAAGTLYESGLYIPATRKPVTISSYL